jgi:hypothetical protein
MRDDGRKPHAVRVPDMGPLSSAFTPRVGQLYWVMSLLYSSSDPAAARPAVVVGVSSPRSLTARIRIVTRTSQGVDGVRHPRDLALRMDRDGVFSDVLSCLASSWRYGHVKLVGELGEPYLSEVIKWAN